MRQRIKKAIAILDFEKSFFCTRALHILNPLKIAPMAAIKFKISKYITAIQLRKLMDLSS